MLIDYKGVKMNKTKSSRFLCFIGVVGFLLSNLACNQLVGRNIIDKTVKASEQKQVINSEKTTIEDIIEKTENTYSEFVYYKANAHNIYSIKGFQDEISESREIKLEYNAFSKVKAEVKTDNSLKILISNDNKTKLIISGETQRNYSDVYWGLSSIEFGNGDFFEVGKILILKERNKEPDSVFQNLINIKMLGEEEINKRICYKVQGTFETDRLIKQTYWIDKESFLIIQFERLIITEKIPGGYFKTVETYTDIEAE